MPYNTDKALQRDYKAVEGSIRDLSERRGVPPEEILMDAEVVCLVDRSGSMNDHVRSNSAEERAEAEKAGTTVDNPHFYSQYSKRRIEHARDALEEIQRKYQGEVLVFQFDSAVDYKVDGKISEPGGTTAMHKGLEEIKQFDDLGMTFIVISDGFPDSEESALSVANTIVSPIHTIYIGNPNPKAEEFMARLSRNGGVSAGKVEPGMLKETVFGLLEAGGKK